MGRPAWKTCDLCGQQFSRASLPIHRKQCLVKHQAQLAQMPIKYQKRIKATLNGSRVTKGLKTSGLKTGGLKTSGLKNGTRTRRIKKKTTGLKSGTLKTKKNGLTQPRVRKHKAPQVTSPKWHSLTKPNQNLQDEYGSPQEMALVQCEHCGRSFSMTRIQRHEECCLENPSRKKRKRFSSRKHRLLQGETLYKFKFAKKQDNYYKKKLRRNKWREEHRTFINAIRSAKRYEQQLKQKNSIEKKYLNLKVKQGRGGFGSKSIRTYQSSPFTSSRSGLYSIPTSGSWSPSAYSNNSSSSMNGGGQQLTGIAALRASYSSRPSRKRGFRF